jgi:hypothetical protein
MRHASSIHSFALVAMPMLLLHDLCRVSVCALVVIEFASFFSLSLSRFFFALFYQGAVLHSLSTFAFIIASSIN